MKFSGNTQEIMDGISIVTRALTAKPPLAVYEGIHVSCDNDTLSLSCSDGQFSINWHGSANTSESGSAIIQGKLFAELLRRLSGTATTITADDKSASVTCGRSRSRLAVISGTFPQHADTSGTAITVPASTLKDLVSHVLDCVATDSSRLILTGALLEIANGEISMVSLDGFRLARIRRQLPAASDPASAIIPRKTLSALANLLPASDDPTTITITDSAIAFAFGPTTVTSTILKGEFVDYSRIIPQHFTTSIRVSKSSLLDAISRATIVARNGKNNLIRFDLRDNNLSVSSRSELGDTEDSIDCDQQGNNLSISFNSAYILDAIRNSPDDTLSISFNSPASPAVISPAANDWLFLVLPVRTA